MKNLKLFLCLCLMVFLTSSMVFAGTVTTTGSGNWNSTTPDAPWPGGNLPTSSDDVIIADGHTVSLDGANLWTITSLTIGQGNSGVLNYAASATAANSLTITGNLTLSAGAQFVLGSLPSVQPNVYLGGNLDVGNAATFDHGSGSSKGVIFNFNNSTGGVDQTITQTGTPTTYQFNKIVVNRPNITDRVVCNCSIKMKGGNASMALTKGTFEQIAGTLEQTSTTATNMNLGTANGVLKITGSGNLLCTSSIVGAGGSNGSDAAIVINTTGTFTTGNLNSQARLQNSNTLDIIAGTVNVYGRFTISAAATISGGSINVDPQGPLGS
ncbi:MAG: hypothetical protein Q8P31_04585, partial [Bacillota bacterium]|nr:hypothetical protein [Bacillota bacterium]